MGNPHTRSGGDGDFLYSLTRQQNYNTECRVRWTQNIPTCFVARVGVGACILLKLLIQPASCFGLSYRPEWQVYIIPPDVRDDNPALQEVLALHLRFASAAESGDSLIFL